MRGLDIFLAIIMCVVALGPCAFIATVIASFGFSTLRPVMSKVPYLFDYLTAGLFIACSRVISPIFRGANTLVQDVLPPPDALSALNVFTSLFSKGDINLRANISSAYYVQGELPNDYFREAYEDYVNALPASEISEFASFDKIFKASVASAAAR